MDILLDFETRLRGRDGRKYGVRACGRERADGLWEGWLEFLPEDGGTPLKSGRETTQPSRDTLVYWATGLTDPYLDGALLRIQAEPTPAGSKAGAGATPGVTDRPSGSGGAQPDAPHPPAILDPFHVHAEGSGVLRRQLQALSADQLRNIIRAYDMPGAGDPALYSKQEPELIGIIVATVETRGA